MAAKRDTSPALTTQQEAAIASLLTGATLAKAAEAAGVDRTTLWRWLKTDAAFVAEHNRARKEQRDAAQLEVRSLTSQAVSTIRDLMTNADAPPAIRLKAALAVLEVSKNDEVFGLDDPADVERDWNRRDHQRRLMDAMNSF